MPSLPDLDLDSLASIAVFTRVVDAKSFSGAAETLGLSKSAVSKHVARLEDRMGTRLLNRTTRRLSTTEAGVALYHHGTRLVEEAFAAEEAVTHLRAVPRGQLRVSAPMSFGQHHIASALGAYLTAYPEVNVDMDLNDRVVDLVEEGYDVAVRIANLPDSSLVARRLAQARIIVCAAPEYLKMRGSPQKPTDLNDHDCLNYAYLARPGVWTLHRKSDGAKETINLSGRLTLNNGDALSEAAAAGCGIVMQPTFIVANAIKEGRLVRVLPEWEGTTIPIYAVFPHSRNLSPKVRAFVDFLSSFLGCGPAGEGTPRWDHGVID